MAQIFSLDWRQSFPSHWESKFSKIKQPSSQRKITEGWRDLFAVVVLLPANSSDGAENSLLKVWCKNRSECCCSGNYILPGYSELEFRE